MLGESIMRRGFCFKCGKEIGGFLRPPSWRCAGCGHLYCERCAKERVGLVFKKPACPECKVEMKAD